MFCRPVSERLFIWSFEPDQLIRVFFESTKRPGWASGSLAITGQEELEEAAVVQRATADGAGWRHRQDPGGDLQQRNVIIIKQWTIRRFDRLCGIYQEEQL